MLNRRAFSALSILISAYAWGCNTAPGQVACGDGASTNACEAVCGNGSTDVGARETCDDGNLVNGDGCSSACQLETGFECTGTPSVCKAHCGDGVVSHGETCDDGNVVNADGCNSSCQIEKGFECTGTPSTCACSTEGTACDDGDLCTQNDTCGSGQCSGQLITCDVTDECQESGACDSASGTCVYETIADGMTCTNGACFSGHCQKTQLVVYVYDRIGDPLVNAKVEAGNATAQTDSNGKVVFEPAPTGKVVAKVGANGYTSAAITVDVQAGTVNEGIAHLLHLGEHIPFNVASGIDIIRDNVRVAIPGDAVVDSAGNPVSGVVDMTIVPIDPSTDLDLSPGALDGVPLGGNSSVGLASVYMADISLWNNSNQLQLKPGSKATIEFTLPDSLQGSYFPGDMIDAWSFDLNSGLWIQEGTGTVGQSAADPTKLSWTFDAPHFTLWNVDYVKPYLACVNVRAVRADNGDPITGAFGTVTMTVSSLSNNFYTRSGPLSLLGFPTCVQLPSDDFMRITASNTAFPNVVGYKLNNQPQVDGEYPQIMTGSNVNYCGGAGCQELTLIMGRDTCLSGVVENDVGAFVNNATVVARYNSGQGPQSKSTTTMGMGQYCVNAPQGAQVLVQASYGPAGAEKTDAVTVKTGVAELTCNSPSCTQAPLLVPICDATCAKWASSYGDSNSQYAKDVALDANGNTFVVGYFSGVMNGLGNPVLTSTGGDDIFVAKFDTMGNPVWAKSFGDPNGAGTQQAYAVAIDSLGNPVIVGSFSSSVKFGGTTLTSVNGYDGFVTKLSGLDGSVADARWIRGLGDQWVKDVAIDNANPSYPDSIVIAGEFTGQVDVTGDLMSPQYVNSNGGIDIFVGKIYGNSLYVQYKTYGGLGDELVKQVAVDRLNNIAITGSFSGSFSFGGVTPTLTAFSGTTNAYAAKLKLNNPPNGVEPIPQWAVAFGSDGCNAGNRRGVGIGFDRTDMAGNSGHVWLTGDYSGCIRYYDGSYHTITGFSSVVTDAFMTRLRDTDGKVLLFQTIASQSWENGSDVAVDTDGGILITGTAQGNIQLGNIALTTANAGNQEMFVAKMTPLGTYKWASRYGGTAPNSSVTAPRIGVRPFMPNVPAVAGDIAIAGYFTNTIKFDDVTSTTSNGLTDIFVAKLLSVK